VVKWSEAKPVIEAYVEKLSEATKDATGKGFTSQEKFLLVGTINGPDGRAKPLWVCWPIGLPAFSRVELLE
jgi:hypothetical protein